MIRIKESL